MTTSVELRELCAQKLLATAGRAGQLTAFVGLDGFVDEILQVVDKRMDAQNYERVPTIARLAERMAEAGGKSTNIELVNQFTKLGGNGPILANALASFGVKVTYLGNLGYPHLHPVFDEFAKRAEVHSIAEPGHTDALELLAQFEMQFDVILGLNEKEANEIGEVLGLNRKAHSTEAWSTLARELRAKLAVGTIVIHPVSYALAVSGDSVDVVKGPYISRPKITTGAGDHFNAGFCLGKLLGLDNTMSVLTGVATSGYYVRTARSPSITDLAELLRHWPGK